MIDHEQWVNVVAMLTGHEPSEVEAAYRKVKATKPPVPLPEAYPEGAAVAIGTVPEDQWARERFGGGPPMCPAVEESPPKKPPNQVWLSDLKAENASLKAERDALAKRIEALRAALVEVGCGAWESGTVRVFVKHTLAVDTEEAPQLKEPHVVWRGSASDFATDVRATLPPDKLDDLVRLLSGPSNRHR